MLAVMATSKTKAIAPKAPATEAPRSLAEIGRDASRTARRKALLAELRRQRWNMTAVAKLLGMSNTSNVLRAIADLGLSAEYEAAKAAGKIPMGPRS